MGEFSEEYYGLGEDPIFTERFFNLYWAWCSLERDIVDRGYIGLNEWANMQMLIQGKKDWYE